MPRWVKKLKEYNKDELQLEKENEKTLDKSHGM